MNGVDFSVSLSLCLCERQFSDLRFLNGGEGLPRMREGRRLSKMWKERSQESEVRSQNGTGKAKNILHKGVQNEVEGCPKCKESEW